MAFRDIFSTLPADLQGLIKFVVKKTSAGNASTTIQTDNLSIFLFSEVECHGGVTHSVAGEGLQYPIFIDNASRVKYLSNGAGQVKQWINRSPRSSRSDLFCIVSGSGKTSYTYGNDPCGVCFGFCV